MASFDSSTASSADATGCRGMGHGSAWAIVFRAVRKEEFANGTIINDKPADGVLHPSFVKTLITGGKRKGQWRDPDVQTFTSGDALYAQTGGGTSLFDKKDVFGDMFWHSFEIPAGTEIPDSLKVEGPDWNPVYKADHYQIECKAKTMPLIP